MSTGLKQGVAFGLWTLTLYLSWLAGPWSGERHAGDDVAADSEQFHMHEPLHAGGKVTMDGQFHLEIVSQPDGIHHLWLSNAVRQEMNPAGFKGTLRIEPLDGEIQEAAFEPVGDHFELRAKTRPLKGQAWLTISGALGEVVRFEGAKLFWDYDSARPGVQPPLGLDPMLPRAPDNPITSAKIELGRELFFDRRLSADGTVSCATCHQPKHAFADAKPQATGIGGRLGQRNAPTVLNAAYHECYYWDGRSGTLEEQARVPLFNPAEMGNESEEAFVARLAPIYDRRMDQVFGEPTSLDTVAKALACFERTLLSGDSDFDRHEAGVQGAISVSARRGRTLFFGRAGCGSCHVPPLLSDYKFHNLGVGGEGDAGRFEVTGNPQDRGAFKTPSLRDVSRTAPYMHDGSLQTLREVVEFYNRGGRPNPSLDPRIEPLGLTDGDMDDLVDFLKTLDGRYEYSGDATNQQLPHSSQASAGR